MAEFDQRGQRVNTQINAESVTIVSRDGSGNLPPQIKFLLDREIKKYLDMDFQVTARSNTKVVLVRPRKTTLGDWFKFVKFLGMLLQYTIKNIYKIETQYVQDERADYDLQKIVKTAFGAENDWVQLEIDMSGNIKYLFEAPTLDEIERLKIISSSVEPTAT